MDAPGTPVPGSGPSAVGPGFALVAPVPPKPAPTLMDRPPTRFRMLADLARLAAQAAADAPLPCAASTAISLVTGLLVPAQLWMTKLLVDALAAQLRTGQSHGAPLWLGLLVGSLLVDRALGGLQGWAAAVSGERIGPKAQERVMRRAARLDLADFEHQGYYDRLRRVLGEAEGRAPVALQQVLGLVRSLMPFLGYAAALDLVSPPLLAVVLFATTPTVLAWARVGQRNWGINVEFTRMRRLTDYYAGILTGRGFAKEVRLYGLGDHVLARWAELFWRARNGQRLRILRSGSGLRAAGSASMGASMLALWLVATHGLHHASAGTYTLLFQSVEGLFGATFGLGQALQGLGEQSGYASEHRAFMQSSAHDAAATAATTAPMPLLHAIRFEDVTFTYPGAAEPALAGVSFDLRAGERVALVGENGAGKTTLAKLLLGLYRPDAGRITVDGVDARDIDPEALRGAMSAVFQHFVRYQLTFAENVALGRVEAMGDDGRLKSAAARAGADEVAGGLPGGVGTVLGPDVGGVDLSGGQWQRVAVARGFFRDAQVLVLDEPTAALDPLAELAVFERFHELAKGRTAVLVSHRLGICRLADRVLVLRQGRLVEAGTHEELMRAGGEYAALFGAQARWYA